MDSLICVLLGVLITLLVFNKEIKIKVHHIHEDVEKEHKIVPVNMHEIMDKNDLEDKVYDEMGENINDINNIIQDVFGGSDRR